MNQIARKV